MLKARYDLQQVICRHSSGIGHSVHIARPGSWIVTNDAVTGRVLGRIAEADGAPECKGWIAAIMLHNHSAGIAWIHPYEVTLVYEHPPARLLAWLTGPDWVRSKHDIARIIAMDQHGTLQEQFIATRDDPEKAYNARPEYAAQWILN